MVRFAKFYICIQFRVDIRQQRITLYSTIKYKKNLLKIIYKKIVRRGQVRFNYLNTEDNWQLPQRFQNPQHFNPLLKSKTYTVDQKIIMKLFSRPDLNLRCRNMEAFILFVKYYHELSDFAFDFSTNVIFTVFFATRVSFVGSFVLSSSDSS